MSELENEGRVGDGDGAFPRRFRPLCFCGPCMRPRLCGGCESMLEESSKEDVESSLSSPSPSLSSRLPWSSRCGLYNTALQLGHVLDDALSERSHCKIHLLPKTHWHPG